MFDFVKKIKHGARIRISLPFFSYEVNLNDLVDSSNVDERIAKLGNIKRELEAAVLAVDSLRNEAEHNKLKASQLKETVNRLKEEKNTAESLLEVPEESFANLISKALSRGRWRGLLEGGAVGFVTGLLSSLAFWYLKANFIAPT